MRRSLRISAIGLAIVVVLSLSGCNPGEDASIFNTWFLDTFFFGTETITFTGTTYSVNTTILFTGTHSGIVEAYDEEAGRIRTKVVSTSGFPAPAVDTVIYWSYSISGNEMTQSNSTLGYPNTVDDNGPYELQ